MMERDEFRDEIRALTGYSDNDGRLTDATLNSFINSSLRRYAQARDWPWLIDTDSTNTATVIGTDSYTLPTDHRRTISVTIDDNLDLQAVVPRQIVQYSGQSGLPAIFAIERGLLYLAPNPASVVNLVHVYLKGEPELVNDTTDALIPAEYVDIPIWAATYLVHARMGDTERMRVAQYEYKDRLREAADDARPYTGGVRPRSRNDWAVS